MVLPLGLLVHLRVLSYLVEAALGSCSSRLVAEWSPSDEYDRFEAASLMPDHPNVWTDG